MKQNLFFISLLALMLTAGKGWGQPWTYNFGTGTGTFNTASSTSTSFLPTPASGTSFVRVGTTGGSINLETAGTGIQKLGSGSRMRIVAPTSGSVVKASVYDYTAGKSFYTKFTLLLGGSDGQNVSSGTFYFFQGDGATYSDVNSFAGAQVFTGLRFAFGASGAITSNYRSAGSWVALGSSPISQSNVYTFEIFGNNTTASIDYTYNGTVYSVANNTQDIWINGVLIGNDLAKAQLGNNVNIDSWMFYGESSTSNVANIFLDDIVYSNSIAASYTTNLNYFSKSSGNINTNTNWTTNNDGTGSINPANFTTGYINYNIRNNATPPIGADWTVSGTNSTVIIGDGTNSASVTANNNISFNSLTINANGSLTIEADKQATISGTFTNNAGTSGLVVASDATGTGSLINSTAGVAATVQRYVVSHGNIATDGWHLMGSPVATFNINGSSFDPGASDDLYSWDEATNTWLNHKAGNPTQIVPGTGYIVAYETTGAKNFSGNLNVADVSVSGLAHNATQGKGWHLLGNPFASALEWNKTGGSWALTNIAGTAKVWNSGSKAYVDVLANGIIPSAQGFFVQVNESTTGSLTIPAAARIHSSTAWYKNTTQRLIISASPIDGSSRQESQIRIESEATSNFDFYYDSRFLPGYAPQFYSISDGEMLSSNALPQVQNETSIPFGFTKNQHESFVIRLEENSLAETVFIEDLKLNLNHNLSQQPEYFFTSAEGDNPNRFLLHFGAVGVGEAIPATAVAAYVSNNILYVLNAQGKVQADVLDLSGRLVHSQSLQTTGLSSTPLKLPAGVYVVRLNDGQTSRTNKVIVQ